MLTNKKRRLPLSVQAHILNQLSQLLKQGYSFGQALKITESSARGLEKKTILKLAEMVSGGLSLAEAFLQASFSSDVSVLVAQAELHGDLAQALAKASEWIERQIKFRTELKKALSYPLFLLILISVIIYVFFQFVIPQFLVLFETYDLYLPRVTRILFTIVTLIDRYVYILPLVPGCSLAFILLALRNKAWRNQLTVILVHLPGIRRVIRTYLTIMFCTQLGYLLHAHVSLYQALDQMAQNGQSTYLGVRAKEIAEKLLTGLTLSDVLAKESCFLPQLSTLVYFAEKNGRLAHHLIEYGHYLESNLLDKWIARLKWIEPTLLVIIGLATAYLFMAVLMPVFQLMETM